MRKRRGCARVALALLLLLAAATLLLVRSTEWLVALGGRVKGERLVRAKMSRQFVDGRFRNPELELPTFSFIEMMRRQFGDEQREPSEAVPVVRRTAADYARPQELRATWMGWSTVLVEIDGAVLLTDPVWSERCSPSTMVGPRRFHQPPIALGDLPPVDVVVISHDHYDHLDMPVVRALAKRGTHFAVPLGIGAHLEKWDVPPGQIHELDWNEHFDFKGLRLIATRARHYSGRNPLRQNETLWSSWVVRGPRHRLFFSGDTGYSEGFRLIGDAHGPFDLTLLKIGASDPTWEEIHMSPAQAVQTHGDLRGRVMLPVHWATFNLAFHAWSAPADEALAAAEAAGVTIVFPRPGELVDPRRPAPPSPWWR